MDDLSINDGWTLTFSLHLMAVVTKCQLFRVTPMHAYKYQYAKGIYTQIEPNFYWNPELHYIYITAKTT